MKPVYFPFTFISRPVIEAVSACLKQVIVYQPSIQSVPEKMQKWAESGMLDIHIPIKEEEEKLDAILKDYKRWINLHQGSEISFLKTTADSPPYFDNFSVSQIRADIREKIQENKSGKKQTLKKNDELFHARIFLLIAQELDMQKFSIIEDLLRYEEMEKDLFQDLKGELDVLYSKTTGKEALMADDPGHYMTHERMVAWTRLMQRDQLHNSNEISGLFVTSSRSVFEHLIDSVDGIQMVLDLDAIPVCEDSFEEMEGWQNRFIQHLEMLVKNPWPPSSNNGFDSYTDSTCDRTVSLKLYIVPGETPRDFWSRFVEDRLPQNQGEHMTGRYRNTLIGLIKFLS